MLQKILLKMQEKSAEDLIETFTEKMKEEASYIAKIAAVEIAENVESILDKATEIIKHH